jgi:2-isopropylmalate synthase
MAEISNITLTGQEPYIGVSAFSHKAGMHVDGVKKNPSTFEHVSPEMVGNARRFLMSEISGRSAVIDAMAKYAPTIDKNAPEVIKVLAKLKDLEHKGYHFEGAEASQELLICKELGLYNPFFSLEKMRISGELPWTGEFSASAFIKISVENISEVTASEGDGPVNAMDRALRKALEVFYPEISQIRLTDYKVRVLDTHATASQVRVLIETTDGKEIWSTIGVSTDILEASWIALVDSLEYKLMKSQIKTEK